MNKPGNKLQNNAEKSPEKLSENNQPESPGIICATPPLRKKKKVTNPVCETSPSLLQPTRRRRKKMTRNSPPLTKIGINCGLLLESSPNDYFIPPTKFQPSPHRTEFITPASPIAFSKKKSKNESSPIVRKTKKGRLFDDSIVTIDEIFTVGPESPLKINRTLFTSPGEKIEESQVGELKKSPDVKSTQIIDEFDTCAIEMISPISRMRDSKGWKPENKIAAILSAERARRSLCCEQNESETEVRKRKKTDRSPLEQYLSALENHKVKDFLESECEKSSRAEGWKDFHVLDVFDGVPMMVRASGEEGLVFIVLSEELLKNQNALGPGSILRIYPPWVIMSDTDDEHHEVFYTAVSGCDVRCVDGRRLQEKVELREIPSEPFLDTALLMRALLGDD